MVLVKEQINKLMEQNSPEVDIHKYGELIFDKVARIYSGEKTASSISGAGKTGPVHVKE